jgi:hypothetical protein
MSRLAARPRHSLAQIRPQESVQIDPFVSDRLKSFCLSLGLAEGDEVRCVRSSAAVLVLKTFAGRTVLLEHDWARFIAVHPSRMEA